MTKKLPEKMIRDEGLHGGAVVSTLQIAIIANQDPC